DVAARDAEPIELQQPLVVGAGSPGPAASTNQTGQSLRVEPGSPMPGQSVAFDGSGLAPDTDAQIRIQNAARGFDGLLMRVHTDARGAFHAETTWPPYATLAPDVYTLRLLSNAPVGPPHPSDTLVQSLNRIGETILLALMGTIFGVLFSAPLSFL